MLVQCDNGETNFNLIACCRYIVDGIRRDAVEEFKSSGKPIKPIHIIFVVQLPKIAGGCEHFVGFQGGKWQSVHIDELLESGEQLPLIQQLVNRSVSDLFKAENMRGPNNIDAMDVDNEIDATHYMDIDVDDQSKISEQLVEVNNCQSASSAIVKQPVTNYPFLIIFSVPSSKVNFEGKNKRRKN